MRKNDFVLLGAILLLSVLIWGGLRCYQGMQAENHRIMREGYTWSRILSRTWNTFRHRPSLGVAITSFFT